MTETMDAKGQRNSHYTQTEGNKAYTVCVNMSQILGQSQDITGLNLKME